MKSCESRTHDVATDIMRLIASFFVVMIHVSGINSSVGIAFNSISRFSVPVFVLISGYYLLEKDMKISAILKKAYSLFAFMIVWAAIYYLYEFIIGTQIFDPISCLKYLLTEPVHLWYFYALITLYLFTPLLSLVYHHASQQLYRYVLWLTFISGSCVTMLLRLDSFSTLSVIVEKMKFPYTQGFIFLYLLGGYVRKYTVNYKKAIYCVGIAASLLNVLVAVFFTDSINVYMILLSFFFPGNILVAIAFFLFWNNVSFSTTHRVSDFIQKCAGATMGIYVLHPLIIKVFTSSDIIAPLFVGSDLLIPVRTIIIFSTALACVLIFKGIPVIKRLV